jgi:LysM repeat protein
MLRKRSLFIVLALFVLLTTLIAAPASANGWGCGPGVTYLVRPGDNLFRIALNHGTTMQAVAAANGIYDYTLVYAGSVLSIPCAGGYTPPVYTPPVYNPPVWQPPVWQPPAWQPPIYVPPASDSNGILPPVYSNPSYTIPPIYVNCNNLYGTSPLGGMSYGDQTFYWNPTPGATSYRVNVYNIDAGGGRVLSIDVPATRTNALLNVGSPAGNGFRFAWDVQALVSDIVVCTSSRYSMFRAVP